MTLMRKNIAFARTTNTAFFKADGHRVPDASDLDSYLFNREARMDEAWGSEQNGPRNEVRTEILELADTNHVRSH